jgi:hypothetical protein
MKQLNLHFSNNNEIEVIVVNFGSRYKIEGIKNNNNFIFVEGDKVFYEKVKSFADLSNQYADTSWDVIDYGFNLNQFNFFKSLVKDAE